MKVHDLIKAKLVADAVRPAAEIFLHHSDQTEKDYILITETSAREKTGDGLADYFRDVFRIRSVTFGPKDTNTIEAAITVQDAIIASLRDVHLTAEIIAGELIANPEPFHDGTSKAWVWNGIFRFTGCF